MINLKDAILKDKRIILRTDFNVPIIKNIIQSTKRIDSSLKTIKFILEQNPKQLIIISHLGRPDKYDKNFTLDVIMIYLSKILNINIPLVSLDDITGKKDLIILLENIRFYPEETKQLKTTQEFRDKLSTLGDVYINDAFGCCHREHSSIVGINTKEKYIGFLIEKEIKYLKGSLLTNKEKTLVLGGSKISDKIRLIENLIPKVNNILIGGGMAFTFLKFKDINIGNSILDEKNLNIIPNILSLAEKYNTKIILPVDFLCNNKFENIGDIKYFTTDTGISDGYMGLDIGKNTIKLFHSILKSSHVIICNGPLGVFEFDNFSNGSKEILEFIADLNNSIKVIGGGDIVSCCEKYNLDLKMNHISTGGGASLKLLEGKQLHGLDFLSNYYL